MPNSTSLKNLKDQYLMLDRNFNDLFVAGNPQQQDQLRRDYVNSRDNFWEARNRVFAENDPLVKKLNQELKSTSEQIDAMLVNLKNVTKILNVITGAVRLGSSIVTMGSALP